MYKDQVGYTPEMVKRSWSESQHPLPHPYFSPSTTKDSALLEFEATIWKEASLVKVDINHVTDQQVAGSHGFFAEQTGSDTSSCVEAMWGE